MVKVSVIVPVYNTDAYLRQCLDSILVQSHYNIELIVVDDGSTDRSGDICDEYAAKDKRVVVSHTPNRGVSAARNAGVDMATGEYVMFVDSDDALHPMMVETLLSIQVDTGCKCVCCAFSNRHEDLSVEGDVMVHPYRKAIELTLYQFALDSSLSSKIFPAAVMKKVKQREDLRYEDLDTIYRIYEALGSDIAVTTAKMYFYRTNDESFIRNFSPARLDVLKVTSDIVEHYKDDPVLAPAARDRRFAANYNMFLLASKAGLPAEADKCWQVVVDGRREALSNPKVRRKNKVGAIASYLGKPVVSFVSKIIP